MNFTNMTFTNMTSNLTMVSDILNITGADSGADSDDKTSELAMLIVMAVMILCICGGGMYICCAERKRNKEYVEWVRQKKGLV
jgi:hypothetical protein